jgi:hypothetical protein
MLSKSDKYLTILLGLIAILAILTGYFRIKKTIYLPFEIERKETKTLIQKEDLIFPNQQDTDNDGLSDFEEEFVYQTSVYNEDSDSDGFSDKEEVDAGSNPLNPEHTPYHKPKQQENTPEENFLNEISTEDISIQEIRDLLVEQGGLSQDIVDKIDDKTLKELYNKTKEETGINLNNLGASAEEPGQFLDLNIEEIRQLLIEQGIDKTLLDLVDDETLKTMFLELFTQ